MKTYSRISCLSLCISVFFLCASIPLFSQTIDRQVIATAGENFHTSNGSLVFTMGEQAVETFTTDIQLSQGFHQEWVVITSVSSTTVETLDVKVFPNPTRGILNIESDADIQILLFELSGKLKLKASQPSGRGQLSIGDFPAGIYILEVRDNTGKRNAMKIEKLE